MGPQHEQSGPEAEINATNLGWNVPLKYLGQLYVWQVWGVLGTGDLHDNMFHWSDQSIEVGEYFGAPSNRGRIDIVDGTPTTTAEGETIATPILLEVSRLDGSTYESQLAALATGNVAQGLIDLTGVPSPSSGPTFLFNDNGIRLNVDASGNLLSISDRFGNRADYTFDMLGYVTGITDPNGDATAFEYDGEGNLTAVVDSLENRTSFAYEDGRLVAETIVVDEQTLTRSYVHDIQGLLVEQTDRNGRVQEFEYDESGRIWAEFWYESTAAADAGTDAQNSTFWGYEEDTGNLLYVDDRYSCITYTYDERDRVLTETVWSEQAPTTILTYDYGSRTDGQPVSVSATVDGVADFVNLYEYDSQGRMTHVRQTGGDGSIVLDKHVALAYDAEGRLEQITRYASLGTEAMVAVTDYRYDEFGRLTGLTHYQDPGRPLAEYAWAYEGGGWTATPGDVSFNPLPDHAWMFDTAMLGNLVQMTSTDGVAEFTYDARGQVVGATYDYQGDEFFSYDANGNRTNPGYETGDHNRLLTDGTFAYEYDGEGNRIRRTHLATGEVTEYTWDVGNRLVAITDRPAAGEPASKAVRYTYDALGRRIAKQIDEDGDGPEAARSEAYVYLGEHIALAFTDDDVTDATPPQLANRYLHGPYIDQLLADEQVGAEASTSSHLIWPLGDHLGTIRDLAERDLVSGLTVVVRSGSRSRGRGYPIATSVTGR